MRKTFNKPANFKFFSLGLRGTGLVEALAAAALLAGVALVGTKIVSELGIKQRNANLTDVRRKLFNYHYDISRTPDGRNNSINANADIVAHANGTSTITPFDTTRRCMQLRDQNNNIILDDAGAATQVDDLPVNSPNYCAAGGKYFASKGGPGCGAGGCNATNATWHVYAVWIPRASNLFDIEIVVRQLVRADGTPRGPKGTMLLENTKGLAAAASAADPYWTLNAATGTVYRDAGAGAYFGFGRSNTNQARLEVVGTVMVSSAMPATEGNTLFHVTNTGQTVIGRKTPIHAAARLDVNGFAGIGPRLVLTPDGGNYSWIIAQGTNVETDRLAFGIRSTAGVLDKIDFKASAATRMSVNVATTDMLTGTRIAIFNQSNTHWADLHHITSGNFHLDAVGGGQTYINWWAGGRTIIGNGFEGVGAAYMWPTPPSDRRLKKDIEPMENSLSLIEQLEGVRYRYRSDNKQGIGFIAQKVKAIFPEAVSAVTLSEKQKDYFTVTYELLVAPLTGAIQELDQRVRALNESTEALKTQQEALESQVDREIAAAEKFLKSK